MSTVIDGSASVTINSGAVLGITSGTAQNSTSGTSIDFTGIPSWVKRITVMFNAVSLSATANYLIQLGYQSPVTSTGYSSSTVAYGGSATSTAGAVLLSGSAARLTTGHATITLVSGTTWVISGVYGADPATVGGGTMMANITLGGTLDRVRITTTSTDTFDAGSINILYE